MTKLTGPQVAQIAAAGALEARGIDGLPTDALLVFAFIDADGGPQLALYFTEIAHGPLGLAKWAETQITTMLINADRIT